MVLILSSVVLVFDWKSKSALDLDGRSRSDDHRSLDLQFLVVSDGRQSGFLVIMEATGK